MKSVKTTLSMLAGLTLSLSASLTYADKGMFDFSDDLLGRVEKKYGKPAVNRLKGLTELLKKEASANTSEEEKLKTVNDFFNQVEYFTDKVHWKKDDYWATPFEKLTTNGGDCEDYAIAKYYALRELGIPDSKLRITYVKAVNWGQAHMVLSYFPKEGDIPLVLDNLRLTIDPADKRKDLIPIYSFNGDGLWVAKSRGVGKRLGNASKNKDWANLQNRVKQ